MTAGFASVACFGFDAGTEQRFAYQVSKAALAQLPGLRVPNQHLANKVAWDAARKADKDLFADLIGVKPEGQNNPS